MPKIPVVSKGMQNDLAALIEEYKEASSLFTDLGELLEQGCWDDANNAAILCGDFFSDFAFGIEDFTAKLKGLE